jgi:hypothetical protein
MIVLWSFPITFRQQDFEGARGRASALSVGPGTMEPVMVLGCAVGGCGSDPAGHVLAPPGG